MEELFLVNSCSWKKFADTVKVISDIMAQWYVMVNTFIISINFYNAKKMNCALLFIISNHYGIIGLSNLIS